MELKQIQSAISASVIPLLIVPYGIETAWRSSTFATTCLLIVPYGIETTFSQIQIRSHALLIVPYGIETPACIERVFSGV